MPQDNSENADVPHAARHASVVAGIAAALLCAVLLGVYFQIRFGINDTPSATGDEPSYDSIGVRLGSGHGFSEDYSDPIFRAPYEAAAAEQPDLMTLPDIKPGPVTYRPPLFPAVIAVSHQMFGRQFLAARIWNIACMAVTAGLLCSLLADSRSRHAALFGFVLFVAADPRIRLYARAILTEAGAVLLTTLMILAIRRLIREQQIRTAIIAGFVTGLSILNRSATALWLPCIAAGLWWLLHTADDSRRRRSAAVLCSVWLLTAAAVYAPWAIRNMRLLQSPMPLGAQGMMEISAGFSESAWQRGGLWSGSDHEGIFPPEDRMQTRIERERTRARLSRDAALSWIKANPVRAVMLGFFKTANEYRPRSVAEWLISLLAVAGAVTSLRSQMTRLFLLFHLANAVAIAATWSVEGRFVVPLLFTIHYWAASGADQIVRWIRSVAGPRIR